MNNSIQNAAMISNTLSKIAVLLVGMAIIGGMVWHGDFLSITIIAAFAIGIASHTIWIFGMTQIKLSELAILVAILGSIVGLTFSAIVGNSNSGRALESFGLIVTPIILWLMGGVARGLWVAQKLGEKDSLLRLCIILQFIFYPFAIVAAIVAIPFALLILGATGLVFGPVFGTLPIVLVVTTTQLWQKARRA